MAMFIDGPDVELISTQLRMIHIDDKAEYVKRSGNPNSEYLMNRLATQEKLESFKQELKQKYNKTDNLSVNKQDLFSLICTGKLKHYQADIEYFIEQEFESHVSNAKFNNNYSIYSKISIRKDISEIKVLSTVLKNGFPVQPKSKSFRILLPRYFNKLNSAFRDGTFRINPFNGFLYFNQCSTLSSQKFDQFIFDSRMGLDHIEAQLTAATDNIRFYFYKILQLIEELPEDSLKYLEHVRERFRKINRQQKTLSLIQKCIECSLYEYQFMFNNTIRKNVNQSEISSIIQKSKNRFDLAANSMFSVNNKIQSQKLKTMFGFFNNTSNVANNQSKITYKNTLTALKEAEKNLIKHLHIPVTRNPNTNQKTNVFSEIFVISPDKIKWEIVAQGGFSRIERGEALFTYCKTNLNDSKNQKQQQPQQQPINAENLRNQPTLRKYLIKKTDKTQNVKIPHEKDILRIVKQLYCMNISKFYQTFQEELKPSLLMDYYSSKSLESYKRSNQDTLSLLSRLFLLIQTVQGLRFLRDYKIVHFDLKPPNLLIAKGMVLKITDFGESYHPQICFQEYRPGYTIPYASPEVFESSVPFGQKIDVFSVGMIMHEILFECFPREVRRLSAEKIMNLYKNSSNQVLFANPERIDSFGPKELTNLLCSLCLKCLSKRPEDRPYLDWIQIILKQCINYLDAIY